MDFEYSSEQEQMASALRRFLAKEYDFAARNRIITSGQGCSDAVWQALAELGLLALPLPEKYGGFDGRLVDLMAIMEVLGEALVIEPFFSTVALGAPFLMRGGTPEQQQQWLPRIATGECRVAFAQQEADARYDLAHCSTTATARNGGWLLHGEKRVVLHGACADLLVVAARAGGNPDDAQGISLFLVAADAPGVRLRGYSTADGLSAADIEFDQVVVSGDALLGQAGDGLALMEEVTDRATAVLCAEAVGVLRLAYQVTLEYLKTRKQFGEPIGSFQALQHRMVELFIDLEQAYSMVCLVCARLDAGVGPEERRRLASAAKIRIGDACRRSSQETVQMQGAMGMSDEMMISHAFRRLTMIAQRLGDAEHHLERFAARRRCSGNRFPDGEGRIGNACRIDERGRTLERQDLQRRMDPRRRRQSGRHRKGNRQCAGANRDCHTG